MILQIDPRLSVDPWWNESGCALLDVFWYVNKFTNFPFDIETILFLGDSFRRHGLVSREFFINNWEGCFNFFHGLKVEYTNRHEPPSRICAPDEFELLYWFNPRTKKHHFTAGDGQGHVTYDSMGESVTVREGRLESKRVFRRLG